MGGPLPLDKIFGEISQFLYSNIQSSICLFLSIYCNILLYIHQFHTCEQFKAREIFLFFKRPLDTRKNCPSWYQESAADKSREERPITLLSPVAIAAFLIISSAHVRFFSTRLLLSTSYITPMNLIVLKVTV